MDWDNLYNEEKFCLKEPAEEVVELLPLLKERGIKRILDLGYGAGRHVVYLAQLGFELYGTDILLKGEKLTRQWLAQERLQAELVISDMTVIPYPDNFFDACICRGVITHNTLSGIQACITEIHRTLAPNGMLMCTFISHESSEYGKGLEIEPNTFSPISGIEEGVPHHYMDKAETEIIMQNFNQISLEHMKHGGLIDTGTDYISAHWVYVGEK